MSFFQRLFKPFRPTPKAETFTCPRREDIAISFMQMGGHGPTKEEYASFCEDALTGPGPDGWIQRDGEAHCSYCGSLHPDLFLTYVTDGCELLPTDKNYKVYVMAWGRQEKFYTAHLSRDQADEFRRLLTAQEGETGARAHVGYPGYFYHGLYLHPAKEDES